MPQDLNSNGSKIHQILNKIRDYLEPHEFPPSPNCLDYDENKIDYIELIDTRLDSYFDTINKKVHNIEIKDVSGKIVFKLDNVIAPDFWSERAVRVCASKYFIHNKEQSIFTMVIRVVRWITLNGIKRGYFNSIDDALTFTVALANIIINQRATFNSPVWFNMGVDGVDTPAQSAACFINGLEDDIASILSHNVIKQLIAIGGSGSGADLSVLRSEIESLSTGGKPSGPCGFFRMFDSNLGAIKSSGKTRRAAGGLTIFHDHPDAIKFLTLKRDEEHKARILAEYCDKWEHNFASESLFSHRGLLYQNINVSVRFRELFWKVYENNNIFYPIDRYGNEMKDRPINARKFMKEISNSAWECGDPGIHYDDNINHWNPFLESGKRYFSCNPCGEMQFLNNSACNLATIKLTVYYNEDTMRFDLKKYDQDIHYMIMAMDILIDDSIYPTKSIAETSWKARNLGLNYADLGALLFKMGLAYGSDEGRYVAAYLAARLTAAAYVTSAELSDKLLDPFRWGNEELVHKGMCRVLKQHCSAIEELLDVSLNNNKFFNKFYNDIFGKDMDILYAKLSHVLDENLISTRCEIRNSQVTIMVPTGTVSFMLDCDTTGIEPYLSHSFNKDLVGGGNEVFNTGNEKIDKAVVRFYENNKLGYMKEHHDNALSMFLATALGNGMPRSTLDPMDHVDMMAAIQPMISLGISKSVNCPSNCTPEDIEKIYYEAWKRGLKAIAVYRDGSKIAQPLTIKKESTMGTTPISVTAIKKEEANYARIPTLGYRFKVANEKIYLHIGFDPATKKIWEVFIKLSGVGGTLDGAMSTTSILVSQMIQNNHMDGAIKTLKRMIFEPSGFISWPDGKTPFEFEHIHKASSIPNAVARMLEAINEVGFDAIINSVNVSRPLSLQITHPITMKEDIKIGDYDNSHKCSNCGRSMRKSGMSSSCYYCDYCDNSEGSCG